MTAADATLRTIARLVLTIAVLIFLLIALAIVLRDVNANGSNSIVKGIHDAANFFAGSFTGIFHIKGHPKREITLDWGIAAIVFLLAGAILARMISALRPARTRAASPRRPAATY